MPDYCAEGVIVLQSHSVLGNQAPNGASLDYGLLNKIDKPGHHTLKSLVLTSTNLLILQRFERAFHNNILAGIIHTSHADLKAAVLELNLRQSWAGRLFPLNSYMVTKSQNLNRKFLSGPCSSVLASLSCLESLFLRFSFFHLLSFFILYC